MGPARSLQLAAGSQFKPLLGGEGTSAVVNQVVLEFVRRLRESETIPEATVARIEEVLAKTKQVTAEDLRQAIAPEEG
jgi:hypothetical protein